jgi:hypothetical protein
LNCNTNKDIEYNTIIVHSTPDIWDVVIKNAPDVKLENKLVIGRTVWEFDKLLPSWVDIINASVVDIVSVPTRWNRECFINSGVIKPIIVEPHVYIDYPYKKTGLKHLLSKSLIICKNESHLNIEKLLMHIVTHLHLMIRLYCLLKHLSLIIQKKNNKSVLMK